MGWQLMITCSLHLASLQSWDRSLWLLLQLSSLEWGFDRQSHLWLVALEGLLKLFQVRIAFAPTYLDVHVLLPSAPPLQLLSVPLLRPLPTALSLKTQSWWQCKQRTLSTRWQDQRSWQQQRHPSWRVRRAGGAERAGWSYTWRQNIVALSLIFWSHLLYLPWARTGIRAFNYIRTVWSALIVWNIGQVAGAVGKDSRCCASYSHTVIPFLGVPWKASLLCHEWPGTAGCNVWQLFGDHCLMSESAQPWSMMLCWLCGETCGMPGFGALCVWWRQQFLMFVGVWVCVGVCGWGGGVCVCVLLSMLAGKVSNMVGTLLLEDQTYKVRNCWDNPTDDG
jgi:hypothetical protein